MISQPPQEVSELPVGELPVSETAVPIEKAGETGPSSLAQSGGWPPPISGSMVSGPFAFQSRGQRLPNGYEAPASAAAAEIVSSSGVSDGTDQVNKSLSLAPSPVNRTI